MPLTDKESAEIRIANEGLIGELRNIVDGDPAQICTPQYLIDFGARVMAEMTRLRELIDDQQSHGETYGRRSGGAKEALFE